MPAISTHAPTSDWRLTLALLCGLLAIVPGIVFFGIAPALPGILLSKLELDRLRERGAPDERTSSRIKVKLARAALAMSISGGVISVLVIALGFFAGAIKLLSR